MSNTTYEISHDDNNKKKVQILKQYNGYTVRIQKEEEDVIYLLYFTKEEFCKLFGNLQETVGGFGNYTDSIGNRYIHACRTYP